MNENSNREFKKIKSLKFLYEINADGTILRNVKSKKQYAIRLDMHHSNKGYYASFLRVKEDGTLKTKRVMIHRLVAECWLGDCPEGMTVDHIDRNTHNNHYSNLRYATQSQQMKNRALGSHVIKQATENCLNHSLNVLAKSVSIINQKTKEKISFRSYTKASEYLAETYNKTVDHIRYKFKKKRSCIYDYDVIY